MALFYCIITFILYYVSNYVLTKKKNKNKTIYNK